MSSNLHDTPIGTVVDGRYRLESKLGAGGVGAVYRARQLKIERDVAIKLLKPDVAALHGFDKRFEREAQALGRLAHPNCLQIHDFGFCEDIDAFYMVTELVPGESLGEYMNRHEIDVNFALRISHEVAVAVEFAHEQGLLHRDLKPENVMITETPRRGQTIKVLDFGLARIMEDQADPKTGKKMSRITRDGEIQGTPHYMSPEQCRGDLDIGTPSDIYALGVMMYELLEGRLPFDADTLAGFLMAHLTKPPPPQKSEQTPEEIRELVDLMLDKKPEQRPTMQEVIGLLAPYAPLPADFSGNFQVASEVEQPAQRVLSTESLRPTAVPGEVEAPVLAEESDPPAADGSEPADAFEPEPVLAPTSAETIGPVAVSGLRPSTGPILVGLAIVLVVAVGGFVVASSGSDDASTTDPPVEQAATVDEPSEVPEPVVKETPEPTVAEQPGAAAADQPDAAVEKTERQVEEVKELAPEPRDAAALADSKPSTEPKPKGTRPKPKPTKPVRPADPEPKDPVKPKIVAPALD